MPEVLVPRTQMPQIDEKDLAKLLVFAGKMGYGVVAGETQPSAFISHQYTIPNKVLALAERPDVLAKPILVTKDFEIIDGNHRWAAHVFRSLNVPYLRLECSFVEALDMLAAFPFAYELTEHTPERN